jgi:hypothetical protein
MAKGSIVQVRSLVAHSNIRRFPSTSVCILPKLKVAGSSPVSRSHQFLVYNDLRRPVKTGRRLSLSPSCRSPPRHSCLRLLCSLRRCAPRDDQVIRCILGLVGRRCAGVRLAYPVLAEASQGRDNYLGHGNYHGRGSSCHVWDHVVALAISTHEATILGVARLQLGRTDDVLR